MGESKYAYLVTDDGLYRVNIPDFDPPHQPEFMLECVAEDFDDIILPTMGIFSKGQDVYLFGGLMFGGRGNAQYNRSLYFFNPRKVKEKEYPIRDSKLLYKSSLKYVPMVTPSVLQAKHKTYLFSVVRPRYGPMKSLCYFQSFDPLKNCFCTLPTPSLDDSFLWYDVVGYFLVYDHIYVFIQGGAKDVNELHAFSFNTRSSKWKELDSLLSKFEERKIPIPYCHCGDIGLSYKFNDNTQILVALSYGTPTAYRVRLGAAGSSLRPKSYRQLLEHNYGVHNFSHLLDIGSQRFCAICSREDKHLLVYAFKMDFAVEYENQGKSASLAMPSIEILCSRKFFPSVVTCVCLAYAPASQRCIPWDKVKPINDKSNEKEPKRKPGVVYLEV
ncbi:uncharacterized protein LOC116023575 [Ipomoea triloba]|uniref:uncharacterized protein LOC116023575 n=1 Tax=Ipomoea triloba TaxID=35885 RepID=UPI00125D5632|nr:uncharacterized protein LOC116023575 [Ipomoea triloba]XP_031120446.1 uncharacterized protein LOC116023575 [Ipomoea triloba]